MRIALLQNGPQIGTVEENIKRADAILETSDLTDVDLIVLPELAMTGYNFPNLSAVQPYLEPTTSGRTTQWATATAKRLNATVIAGYPEISTETDKDGNSINYNATVTVDPNGALLANYRKSFLYYTDESWATEGTGFFCGPLGKLGNVGLGICMDINPYEFTSPWEAYEFCNHMIAAGTKLIVLSMAWLTHTAPEILRSAPDQPDLDTIGYWIQRFSPMIKATETQDEEVFVVFTNRVGTEKHLAKTIHARNGQVINLESDAASYAGSSCVMRFHKGQVSIMDMLGQAQDGLLVVDTAEPAKYELKVKPVREAAGSDEEELATE